MDNTEIQLVNTGNIWFNKKEYTKAIEDYNKAIALDENYAIAYNNRGLAWYYKKEYDKAIEDYNKTIALDEKNAKPYNNRGLAWSEKKEYDKAIEDYNKATALDEKFIDAYYNRGNAWYNKKEYEKAISDYNEVINLNDRYIDAYNNRGLAQYYKKLYDESIKDFDTVISIDKNYIIAYNNRGLARFEKKEYQKAIEDYNNALRLKPDYANAYRNLGVVYAALNDYDNAINHYEKAISLDQTFSWLQTSIDEIKAKTKKINEVEVPKNDKAETSLYFLVKTIDKLNISDGDKRRLKNNGNDFLQAINAVRDISFADNKHPVAHYTKLKVADIIVSAVENPKLRYYNVVYMNDPEEGEIIFDCLDNEEIVESFKKGKQEEEENNIYLGSFLPAEENSQKNNHEDELVMWRTYGKDEFRNEASGCSIVINQEFFGRNKQFLQTEMNISGDGIDTNKNLPDSQALYSVLYYDKRDRKLVESKGKELNAVIDDLKSAIKTFISLKDTLGKSDEKNIAINKIVYRFISEIRYLFKSADFAFENELRVIQYASPQIDEKANLVKIDDNNNQWLPRRLYIESNKPVRPHIKRIYLGSKVSNPKTWMYLEASMKLKGYNIEVKPSVCKFQ